MMNNFAKQRQQLKAWLQSQGISDARVLAAMNSVPRELFVEDPLLHLAYADRALPISMGQTISQPLMVAVMTQALELSGWEHVLEIGTGSGYQTAIVAQLAGDVCSVERYQQLAMVAAGRMLQLERNNVTIYVGDGSLGWIERAPYDRILVTAAAPVVPPSLVAQLVVGGLLVIPVGSAERQDLLVICRTVEGTRTRSMGSCVFVPLVGEEGWSEEPPML